MESRDLGTIDPCIQQIGAKRLRLALLPQDDKFFGDNVSSPQ